ncbi:MAG: TetR/AcrR family transcriptional regulator [Spirochaetes bacterium]|nr:TetR/AcrR family transcriptional regulator [Spirochaetota bacterium]
MPRTAATPEKIEQIRNDMINEAISLINEAGFANFSMRKLGSRLDVTAKTIYNYFTDKDELYLHILTRGFEMLRRSMEEAAAPFSDPSRRLQAMAHAYVRFGIGNPYYYNVLFNLDLPRFIDYRGTKHEKLADFENRTALAIAAMTKQTIDTITKRRSRGESREALYYLMKLWSILHGIVSLNNSRVTMEVGDFEKVIARMVDDAVKSLFSRQSEKKR